MSFILCSVRTHAVHVYYHCCTQVVLAVQSNAMLTFDYVILSALARCVSASALCH